MKSNTLEDRFYNHIIKYGTDGEGTFDHFVENGKRYVKCDRCKNIVSTDDCVYYGGLRYRSYAGVCRNCYNQGVKK